MILLANNSGCSLHPESTCIDSLYAPTNGDSANTQVEIWRVKSTYNHMGMDQYLLIPFLGEWTSIYQLFWCSPGVQGFDTLPHEWSKFPAASLPQNLPLWGSIPCDSEISQDAQNPHSSLLIRSKNRVDFTALSNTYVFFTQHEAIQQIHDSCCQK